MKRYTPKHSERDWPEDRPGRGLYYCMCKCCHKHFGGHKARTICKVCDSLPQVHIQGWRDMPKETQDALVKMFQIIADNLAKGINPIKGDEP